MTMPSQITGVHTVGVPVTDQDRAIDFYVGTLGFDKRLDADMGGGPRRAQAGLGGWVTGATRVFRERTSTTDGPNIRVALRLGRPRSGRLGVKRHTMPLVPHMPRVTSRSNRNDVTS